MTRYRQGWGWAADSPLTSFSAHLDGDPGCGEWLGEEAALPRKLLVPLLLADPGAELVDRTEEVSDRSSELPFVSSGER